MSDTNLANNDDEQQSWQMHVEDDAMSLEGGDCDDKSLASSNMGSVEGLFTDQLHSLNFLFEASEKDWCATNTTTKTLAARLQSFDEDSCASDAPNGLLREELTVADAAASLTTLLVRMAEAASSPSSRVDQEEAESQQDDQEEAESQQDDQDQYWDDDEEDSISHASSHQDGNESVSSSSSHSRCGYTTEGTPPVCDISSIWNISAYRDMNNDEENCFSSSKKKHCIPDHVTLDALTVRRNTIKSSSVLSSCLDEPISATLSCSENVSHSISSTRTYNHTHVPRHSGRSFLLMVLAFFVAAAVSRVVCSGSSSSISNEDNIIMNHAALMISMSAKSKVVSSPKGYFTAAINSFSDSIMPLPTATVVPVSSGAFLMKRHNTQIRIQDHEPENEDNKKNTVMEHQTVSSSHADSSTSNSRSDEGASIEAPNNSRCKHGNALLCATRHGIWRRQ